MTSQLELLAKARKPKRHEHQFIIAELDVSEFYALETDATFTFHEGICRCGLTRADYEARQKRGRTSLRAGKDGERAIAKAYGGTRVGQYGGASDVDVGELFSVQSKVGWFSERMWAELAKLPRTGGRIPTLIVSDRPGPGHKTRRLVIRLFEDDVALHGEKP